MPRAGALTATAALGLLGLAATAEAVAGRRPVAGGITDTLDADDHRVAVTQRGRPLQGLRPWWWSPGPGLPGLLGRGGIPPRRPYPGGHLRPGGTGLERPRASPDRRPVRRRTAGRPRRLRAGGTVRAGRALAWWAHRPSARPAAPRAAGRPGSGRRHPGAGRRRPRRQDRLR